MFTGMGVSAAVARLRRATSAQQQEERSGGGRPARRAHREIRDAQGNLRRRFGHRGFAGRQNRQQRERRCIQRQPRRGRQRLADRAGALLVMVRRHGRAGQRRHRRHRSRFARSERHNTAVVVAGQMPRLDRRRQHLREQRQNDQCQSPKAHGIWRPISIAEAHRSSGDANTLPHAQRPSNRRVASMWLSAGRRTGFPAGMMARGRDMCRSSGSRSGRSAPGPARLNPTSAPYALSRSGLGFSSTDALGYSTRPW